MRKLWTLITAMIACAVLGLATLSYGAKDTIRARTDVDLDITRSGPPPYDETRVRVRVSVRLVTNTAKPKLAARGVKSAALRVCQRNRKVRLIGHSDDRGRFVLARGRTNARGTFKESIGDPPPATYRAKVKGRTGRVRNDRIRCEPARSSRLTISG